MQIKYNDYLMCIRNRSFDKIETKSREIHEKKKKKKYLE